MAVGQNETVRSNHKTGAAAAGFNSRPAVAVGAVDTNVHHRRANFCNGPGDGFGITVEQFIIACQQPGLPIRDNGIVVAKRTNEFDRLTSLKCACGFHVCSASLTGGVVVSGLKPAR
jgi:hypothetical protein